MNQVVAFVYNYKVFFIKNMNCAISKNTIRGKHFYIIKTITFFCERKNHSGLFCKPDRFQKRIIFNIE